MSLSKWRIAAVVERFPFALRTIHVLWRLTRPHFTVGVVGVLFNPLGEVLIVEHVYHAPPRWGLPGGYLDRGEEPHETVVRELREELEIECEVERILLVERGISSHLDFAYLCRSDSHVGQVCDELLSYRWVRPEQLPEMHPFQRRAIRAALALLDVTYDH
jgi:8-oxo-dGTP pyrophosphatase MutT (NUDIX family)